MKLPLALTLPLLLAACADQAPAPLATTVCELVQHPQRTVQLQATLSVNPAGSIVMSDAACATTRVELRLSSQAERAGYSARLQQSLQPAGSFGEIRELPGVTLTGVLQTGDGETFFSAETLSGVP
jgi:hypothetical protein